MGSGGDKATKAAQRAEAERRARINANTAQVNRIFDAPERQQQYADFVNALRGQYRVDATRQKADVDRAARFSLARSGNLGGSVDTDSRRRRGEEFNRGLVQAVGRVQDAASRLRSQDEASRLNLIQLASSGGDVSTAAARAGAQLSQNAQAAAGEAVVKGLGDVFSGTYDVLKKQREAEQFRRGQQQPVGGLYGRSGFGG